MMRTLIAVIAVLMAVYAEGASGETFGAHSSRYQLELERRLVAPDRVSYGVRVIETASGKSVLDSTVAARPGEAVDATAMDGAEKIAVHIAYTPNFFSATLNVTHGATIDDEFRTWWQLEPRTPSQSVNAPPPPMLDTAGALRVGGDVKAPRIIRRVEPTYTDDARRDRISGIVIVEVRIGTDGLVKDAVVLKPLPDGLSEAALDAVRQWQFEPATLNGAPVQVLFNLTVNFKLELPAP